MLSELPHNALAGQCHPALIPFDATDQAPPGSHPRVLGQDRAMHALAYALSRCDSHTYVAAPIGAGCEQLVQRLAAEAAAKRPAPDDLCTVFNFEAPAEPTLMVLPPGSAPRLRRAMDDLLEDIGLAITAALRSRETTARMSEIDREFSDRREEVEDDATRLAAWARERHKRRRALTRSVARRVVEEAFGDMRRRERLPEEAQPFLSAVMMDLIDSAGDRSPVSDTAQVRRNRSGRMPRGRTRRYSVNVLSTTSGRSGAPLIVEDDASVERLFGWLDAIPRSGAGASHQAIRPGALHRAYGGILVLPANALVGNSEVWTSLKRAMKSGRFWPVALQDHMTAGPLPDPEPSPFNTQIILIGDASLHAQHAEEDEEFLELFRVFVDFDPTLPLTPSLIATYAGHIADLTRDDGVRPVGRDGVARLIEHSMRLAGDRRRLTARTSLLHSVIREADALAAPGDRCIDGTHIDRAIAAARARTRRPAEQIIEDIVRDAVRIETDGVRIGQLNGLMVGTSAGVSFAHPARITARVRLGEGDVVDIEREVEFGGAAHSKGVLILSGFMGGRYAPDRPLSLWASLVFEQSYGGIDGDSASAAELACLLSAIGEVPVTQSLAVTGSVNQHGELQAVGDVTEKVEGFFDICAARGLTGVHGVVIPAANIDHLNVSTPVIEAVAAAKFHIYVAHTIDDVLAAISGLPAGEREQSGHFPPGTFNELVERRLLAFAEERKAYKGSDEEDDG